MSADGEVDRGIREIFPCSLGDHSSQSFFGRAACFAVSLPFSPHPPSGAKSSQRTQFGPEGIRHALAQNENPGCGR